MYHAACYTNQLCLTSEAHKPLNSKHISHLFTSPPNALHAFAKNIMSTPLLSSLLYHFSRRDVLTCKEGRPCGPKHQQPTHFDKKQELWSYSALCELHRGPSKNYNLRKITPPSEIYIAPNPPIKKHFRNSRFLSTQKGRYLPLRYLWGVSRH